ncbi:hypothetical protein FSP39_014156 [Pinctada imbricata]|uniref:alanine--tRNA ligase n=1 Tax=Pinctada imbricata TaxID=66713 RepID=A0AA88XZB8_PINIB|nr:hypothetical protein FSP39_014156 [Pinctada imbricata]
MAGSMKILGLHTICSRCMRILHRTQRLKSTWSSAEVRSTFLDYFCQKQDHLFVPSSSVIPKKGEGTYFTNAGMNQFKPIFLGSVDKNNPMASYRRVANSQKCVRVGGKHNDLEDVGKDLTHHTFFEMLGSWSFGDYFKKEACRMALELLTKEYKLSLDRLYITYFAGCESAGLLPDNETREIWLELGVPESRVLPFGMKDNFWDMGDTGPCGPCTEIHLSHRGNSDCSHLVNADSPEVVEIWNLVFMQYNRDISQKLLPLPSQHVDTGMGLERIVGVLQNTMSNYDTDLFMPLFNEIHKNSKYGPYRGRMGKADKNNTDKAYRIIADHIRMATVCIADGLLPDKSKLGHKLRSIIYRCIEQSFILKMDKKRLSSLVDPVSDILGDAYPEIPENESKIKQVLESCENGFWKRWGESQFSFRKFLRDRDSNKEFQVHEFLPLLDGAYGRKISIDMLESVARTFNVPLDSDQLHDLLAKRNAEVQPSPVPQSSNTISAALLQSLLSQNVPETEDVYKYSYTSKDGVYGNLIVIYFKVTLK